MTEQDDTRQADGSFSIDAVSRREVLKASAGAGALAVGVGTGAVGSASAGIPTPQLSVEGNTIVDPSGNAVKLRGLNMADPKRLNVTAPARGKNALQVVDLLTDTSNGWHPKVIRIPVQPVDIGEHTPGSIDGAPEPQAFDESQLRTYIDEHLRDVVERCAERNVYCIIDYHRHWKPLEWAEGQQGPINQDLYEEGLLFWEVMAEEFGDMNHVIFEIYNEPTEPALYGGEPGDQWIADLWSLFQDLVQPWIDTIRAVSNNHVIVGSPGWSQHIQGVLTGEMDGGNLSYTYHIYPGHGVSQQESWAEGTGTPDQGGTYGVYEEVPMFVTEFGWQPDLTIQDHGYETQKYLKGTASGFGESFMDFLESSPGINWTAWCADPIWLPKMFEFGDWVGDQSFTDSVGDPYSEEVPTLCEDLPCEWNLTTGEFAGQFIKDTLAELKDDGNPSGEVSDPTPDPSTPTDTPTPEGPTDTPTPDPTTPTPADGTAMDHDGDGLYEDVNGNGESDFGDVTELFDSMDSVEDGSKFDFNENGELDFGDVVALFGRM